MSLTKIIGVGLNKTGTTTLGTCFKHWGFKHSKLHSDAFGLYCAGRIDDVLKIAEGFDSFEDWPWPLVYERMDRAFPNSKFILTTRLDAETWFTSLCQHADRTGPTKYRKHIYGHAMPQAHREEHIRFYEKHNAAVRKYFQSRPGQLLEVCWERGDGWRELSEFLNLPQPHVPFPHANQTRRSQRGENLSQATRWIARFRICRRGT